MANIAGIVQSITRAWHLLGETGFLDMSRGLNTDGWQQNIREAVRELREAASSLVAQHNRDAYGELESGVRLMLWKSILRARAPATGEFIISRLGGRYRNMTDDVRAAERELAGRANGFPTRQLHQMTSIILNASPDEATAVEQEAARQGDPMPRGITPQEAALYQRILLRAMQQSNREVSSHRNAGDAAIDAFGESLIPAHALDDILMDQAEGRGLGAVLGEAGGEQAGLILNLFRAISSAADAHHRQENAQYRLNYWVRQTCLAESRNNSGAAAQLERQLLDIKRRMDEWLSWLQRHQDHPSYVPPGGRWEASPLASAESLRSGAANWTGPVSGSVRGPSSRGPVGMT
jgi:hypothetical protein